MWTTTNHNQEGLPYELLSQSIVLFGEKYRMVVGLYDVDTLLSFYSLLSNKTSNHNITWISFPRNNQSGFSSFRSFLNAAFFKGNNPFKVKNWNQVKNPFVPGSSFQREGGAALRTIAGLVFVKQQRSKNANMNWYQQAIVYFQSEMNRIKNYQ
jgi:hypothetical protein